MLLAQPQRQTLGQALVPHDTLLRQIVAVLVGSFFIALCARASINLPIGPVPITGLTFGALVAGALLGPRLGALAAVAYLAQGIAGLPFFAGGLSGWAVMTGSTGGYLFAAPIAAFVVGWLAQMGADRRPWTLALSLLLGNVIFYAIGLPMLYLWGASHEDLIQTTMTADLTLRWGLIPFIPGDLAKLLLAAAMLPAGWQALHAARLGPARVIRGEAPAPTNLAPVGIAAGAAMIIAAILPWTDGDLGVTQGAGWAVLAAGLVGATSAWLRTSALIGPVIAQIVAFVAASAGLLVAFVNLVTFTADGEMTLADVSLGVSIAALASLALLAFAISETGREDHAA